ncbi:type I restriction enzyme S subunit [Paraburkholderia sp. WSM4175]|uniref:restriction endonuclease subunit S n=1 Tax=Paraburkholderia sp. WSM4175 TaxID=2991072 RepID=UPI003D238B60
MSLPKYPKYKDSGVEWLGKMPTHWQVSRLKQVIACIESGVSVNAIDAPAGEDESGVLKTSCVYGGEFVPSENKSVVPEELDRLACPVREGTLIVSRMNTPDLVGAAGVVRQSRANLYLPDRLWQVHFKDACPRFVHFWSHTPSYRAQVERACAGTSSSMQNLSQDEFRSFTLPLPPLAEQSAIAAFLDQETGKIDELIAEQEKLVTLLAEKRRATISHAVTRGLNPGAPMKDSSVEWLGEVPMHWKVCQLKRVFASVDYGISDSLSAEGDVAVLRMGNISDGKVHLDDLKYVDNVDTSLLLRAGDILFNRTNSIALVGKVGLFTGKGDAAVSFASYLVRIRLIAGHFSRFFAYLLNTPGLLGDVRSRAFEAIGQCNLNPTRYGQLMVAIAPPVEQEAIVAYLDSETSKLDDLRAEAQRAIELLTERRMALIAAAVTGKIDVPETAPE